MCALVKDRAVLFVAWVVFFFLYIFPFLAGTFLAEHYFFSISNPITSYGKCLYTT